MFERNSNLNVSRALERRCACCAREGGGLAKARAAARGGDRAARLPARSCCGRRRAVGSPLVMDPNSICRKTRRLASKQAELCVNEPEVVREVIKGARLALRECQHQFRHRRWNCSGHVKYFGKVLQQGEELRGATPLVQTIQRCIDCSPTLSIRCERV